MTTEKTVIKSDTRLEGGAGVEVGGAEEAGGVGRSKRLKLRALCRDFPFECIEEDQLARAELHSQEPPEVGSAVTNIWAKAARGNLGDP